MTLLGNSLEAWAIGLGVAAATWLITTVIKRLVIRRASRERKQRRPPWDELVLLVAKTTRQFSLLMLAINVGSRNIEFPERTNLWIDRLGLLTLLFQLLIWGSAVISYTVDYYVREKVNGDGSRTTSVRALGILGRFFFYVTVVLWGLDNFGVNITTLVAGLGVGGVAVALATQNILGDLFSSITIVLDKPFVIGDFIVVDGFEGTIEHIGLKTTRVRSINGEQLIFPNANLLQSRVRNYKRMQERRVLFTVGIAYGTPAMKVETLPKEIQAAIEKQALVRFDRAFFKRFGEHSLDYEVVYWVLNPEYSVYARIQEAINLEIYRKFTEMNVEFAFPTRTIHMINATGE